MVHEILDVGVDPAQALETIRDASVERPVLVFKKSPICPVSQRAEMELKNFLASLSDPDRLALVSIDVIAQRPLARGLTAELDLRHESPQALWFTGGELGWHGSHGSLTAERFRELQHGERGES